MAANSKAVIPRGGILYSKNSIFWPIFSNLRLKRSIYRHFQGFLKVILVLIPSECLKIEYEYIRQSVLYDIFWQNMAVRGTSYG